MDENPNMDSLFEELADRLTDELESIVDDTLSNTLQEAIKQSLEECLTDYSFLLPDGWALNVQTQNSCWEVIAVYPAKEEAVASLEKVSTAMEAGEPVLRP